MNKDELIKTMREQLRAVKQERENAKTNVSVLSSKIALKAYQLKRLKETHADLLFSSDTKGAAEFFFKEIYGVKDLTQRDKDIEKLIPIMETAFPLNALETITQAIVLDALSEKLDTQMALRLGANFTEEEYMQAFREIGTKEERETQINLVETLGLSLCQLVRIPLLATSLKVMRIPAKIAGIYNLHEFLESGFTVFKNTKNPENFVLTLVRREREILANIYGNSSTPFLVK